MEATKTLTVRLSGNEYDILIGDGLLKSLGDLLKSRCAKAIGGSVSVVTDENVWALYREPFSLSLTEAGIAFHVTVLPAGEGSKSPHGLSLLYDAFARQGMTRSQLVVVFGGGVPGDLGGFAAATWMRGVGFVQVPTTLIAQVDSSVGGKTAIDLPQGKNLVGAFHQPKLVVIDPLTLQTLPEREEKSGAAEVIKYGAIRSLSLFESLGVGGKPGDPDVIHECCRVKSEIVERDERDFGERMLLNFGHTFGHAIEKETGFERYRHGEAVAFGMTLAAAIGEKMGLTEPGSVNALRRVLNLHGLDADLNIQAQGDGARSARSDFTGLPETPGSGDPLALLPALAADKKSLGSGIQMVFLRRIGEAFVRHTTLPELEAALKAL
ncbi:MAG: 3-dehydroquinate synthase [Synergistaceae bacterium]|jgi:3-dehydroquinate synthase|nr:3-dehydroquinate synthase [Synergistaceae bacterium]